MTLGERLKLQRERRGWTQIQAAKKTGFSSQVISNYERDYRTPDPDALAKLADIYDVNVDYLIGRTDDPTPGIGAQMVRAMKRGLRGEDLEGNKIEKEQVEKSISENYNKLPPAKKKLIDDMINALLDEET